MYFQPNHCHSLSLCTANTPLHCAFAVRCTYLHAGTEIPSWSQQSVRCCCCCCCVILGDTFLEIPHLVLSSAPAKTFTQRRPPLAQRRHTNPETRIASDLSNHGPPQGHFVKPSGLRSGSQGRKASGVDGRPARQRPRLAEGGGVPGGGGGDPAAPSGMRAAAAHAGCGWGWRVARMENANHGGRRHVSRLGGAGKAPGSDKLTTGGCFRYVLFSARLQSGM